ncbi:MAG: bifunctional 4-hydroxy-2-oxoglutarate aldolase/2-dehydro-3-deoxy-phosphogluconate aldolase [Saprospiraceae bacterium]|nr:bifunctional 4-hydroxy-2-oxoglutarate aldolase/2-dehydro-3-deoxy-phosphogluconate aldolase [Saprospiraceae bacterium]
MDRLATYQTIAGSGLVPLFYHPAPQMAFEVAVACHRGGAKVLEFTNRGHFAHEVFAELRKRTMRELPGLLLGVGSVQDAGSAALYLQMGADFVITPLLREDVILTCNRRKVAIIPGVSTSSEIGRAEELGCELVKIAPGEVLGPQFLKAHRAPCPWTRAMISGGVSPDEANLREWFEAGAACVGIGSKLISSEILEKKDWLRLEEKVQEVCRFIQTIRA